MTESYEDEPLADVERAYAEGDKVITKSPSATSDPQHSALSGKAANADPPWSEVPWRDCYTKVQGRSCGREHGWGSWLGTIYRCAGTPGAAVAALDSDGQGVPAPTPPPPPVKASS